MIAAAWQRRRRRQRAYLLALALALLTSLGIASTLGAVRISPPRIAEVLRELLAARAPRSPEAALLILRLPRAAEAALVGGGLALAGAAMQALFRNPLADPGLLGVSGGASLGAALLLVLVRPAGRLGALLCHPLALTFGAFLCGLLAAMVVAAFGRARGRTSVVGMLLAGIAVSAICGAGHSLLSYVATDAQLRGIAFWSLGSLGGTSVRSLLSTAPLCLLAAGLLLRRARPLGALLLGETAAGHLGVDVERLKREVLALSVFLCAVAVAQHGIIAFVGLIAPQLARLLLGSDPRAAMPGALLLGALLLVAADTLCRTAVAPAELPIGAITSALGGPFFLGLLWRLRARTEGLHD
jgi:iron complex transport system permease protein